ASSTTGAPWSSRPADGLDANTRTCSYPRSASRRRVPPPTAPVAPTPPIRAGSGTDALLGEEAELLVHGPHGGLDLGAADDAGDSDRRRGDDLDVDAGFGERLEHVRGDARVALHSRADERHLPDLGVVEDAASA